MEHYLRSKRTWEFLDMLNTLLDEPDGNAYISFFKKYNENEQIMYDEKDWPFKVVIKPKNSPTMKLGDFIEAVDWEKMFGGNYMYHSKGKNTNIYAKLRVHCNDKCLNNKHLSDYKCKICLNRKQHIKDHGFHNHENDMTVSTTDVPIQPTERTGKRKFTDYLLIMCESGIKFKHEEFDSALVYEMTICLENEPEPMVFRFPVAPVVFEMNQ